MVHCKTKSNNNCNTMYVLVLLYLEGVSKRSRLTNCRFKPLSSQIFAIYIISFHKTEVQTVILRCWTDLHLNWFKSQDKNEKQAKNAKTPKIIKTVHGFYLFLQNSTKTKMEIIAFCIITLEPIKVQTCLAPQNDRLNLSFVKDIYVDGGNLARKGCKTAISQSTSF